MLSKIPQKYLDDPAYHSFLVEGGFLYCELSNVNKVLIDLYNKIVDPTNLKIDWDDYFSFCYLEEFPNIKNNQEIMLHIRETISKYREKMNNKDSNLNKNNDNNDEERIKRI